MAVSIQRTVQRKKDEAKENAASGTLVERIRASVQSVPAPPAAKQTPMQQISSKLNVTVPTPTATQNGFTPGSIPSTREVLARITEIGKTDQARANEALEQFYAMQQDSSTPYYNPYAKATNQNALSYLSEYLGEDLTGGVSEDWLSSNRDLLSGARYTTTGEAPAAPTKSSTPEQNAAYWYYQLLRDEETTQSAEADWQRMKDDIAYYVSRGLSDDEVLAKVQGGTYGALQSMEKGKKNGVPVGMNRAVDYSEDTIYGAIWAARNGGGTGNGMFDAVNYTMGTGNKYKPDPTAEARRNPGSPDYQPYESATIEDAMRYFGVTSFDADWQDENRWRLSDGSKETQRMFERVGTGIKNANEAQAELSAMWEEVETALTFTTDADEILNDLRYADGDAESGKRNSTYSTLWKMDEARLNGDPLALAFGVNYRWEDIEAAVRQRAKTQIEAREAVERDAKTKEERKQRAVGFSRAAAGLTEAGEAVAVQPEQPGFWQRVMNLFTPSTKAAPKAEEAPAAEPTPGPTAGPTAAPTAAPTAVPSPSPTGAVDDPRDAVYAENQAQQAERAEETQAVADVITARANEHTAEELAQAQTFLSAANGHTFEAAEATRGFWGTVKDTVVGTENTPVFTDADESQLDFLRVQLRIHPQSELADYWKQKVEMLEEKRDKYTQAYGQSPTYQQRINSLHEAGDDEGVTNLLASGLHIHTAFTYGDINKYLVPALSTMTDEAMTAEGYSEFEQGRIAEMRGAISKLFARPVPEANVDGWLQGVARFFVDTLQGQGAYERAALNEGIDIQTLGTLATGDMFSLSGKALLGFTKLAAVPVKGAMGLAGQQEAYQAAEDRLINDEIRLENARLEASGEALAKHGTGGDMLLYQMSRDTGKALLELGYVGGTATGIAAAGGSTALARNTARLMYGLQSAGSAAADLSLTEGADTLQWVGASLASGLITMGVMALGVEDKVLGRWIEGASAQTGKAILDTGARKGVALYGRKFLNFIKELATGFAGEYAEEGLEEGLSAPLTDLIMEGKTKPAREYLSDANRAGISGGLIGLVLAGATYSAAAPETSRSHQMMVEIMEDIDAGTPVAQESVDAMIEQSQADLKNPEIIGPVIRQAGDLQVSEVLVDSIAKGGMDAVYDGPEANAVQTAMLALENATAELRDNMEARNAAGEAENAARSAFLQNPADTGLLEAFNDARDMNVKATETFIQSSKAQRDAEQRVRQAQADLEAVEQSTYEALRMEAEQAVVQLGQDAETKGKDPAARAMLGAEAPLRAHAQGDAATNPSDDSIAERAEKSTGDSGATDGMRFMSVPAEAAGAAAAALRQPTGKLRNPIEITAQLANDIGVGNATRSKKFSAGTKALPKAVQGYYASRQGYINARNASDYNTNMHEIGHAIEQRIGLEATQQMVENLDPVFTTAYGADELRGEAFAEFVRRYMTDEQTAIDFADEAYVRDFENALREAGLYQAVRKQADAMRAYVSADAGRRIASRIVDQSESSATKRGIVDALKYRERAIVTAIADWTRPAEEVNLVIDQATGQYPQDKNNLRDVALRRNHDNKIANTIMTDVLLDPDGNRVGDSMKKSLEGVDGKDFRLFNEYLLLKHSLDRDAQGKTVFGDEFSAEQRVQRIEEIEQSNPEFSAAQQSFVAFWQQFMQSWMVDTGLLAQDIWDAMKEMYPNYVPTYRQMGEGVRGGAPSGSAFQIRAAKGSDLNVITPMDSIIRQIGSIVHTVNKNAVGVAFDNLYNSVDGMGWFGEQIPSDKIQDATDLTGARERVKNTLENFGGEGKEDLIDSVLAAIGENETRWTDTGTSTEQNVIQVIRPDGERVFYRINDVQLYKMLTFVAPEGIKGVLGLVGRVTRQMSKLQTGDNIRFSISNFIRDFRKSVSYGSWSSNYLTGALKWLAALPDTVFERGEFAEYRALGNGGWSRMDARTQKSATQYRRDLFKGYRWSSPKETAKTLGRGLWSALTLQKVNEWIEANSRYVEYKYGKHDKSTVEGRQRASVAAKEVTVDFSRHGASALASDLTKFIPFFGANVQGIYQSGRMFTKAERSRLGTRVTKTVINAGVASAISYLLRTAFLDDEDKDAYTLLADAIRFENTILPNPFESDRRFIRLPIGQDPLDKICNGLFTLMFDAGESTPLTDDFLALGVSILEGFNPASSTIVDPLISMVSNISWFGSLIESEWLQGLPVTQRYDETTPEIFVEASRALGGFLGLSPVKLQYLFEQYSGVIGQTLVPAISKNRYTGEVGGIAAVKKSAMNRFTIDPSSSNDITNAFNEQYNRLLEIQREFRDRDYSDILMPELTEQETMEAYTAAKELTASGGAFASAKDRISELWAEIDEIQTNETLTDAQRNKLTTGARMEMVYAMQEALEYGLDYEDAYIGKRGFIQVMPSPKTPIKMPTALDTMPDAFRADLDSGAQYMQRAQTVWEATGKDAALPHPNDGFTVTDSKTKVQTEYVIPDEYRAEWDAEYRKAYEKAMRISDATWDAKTDDQRLDALRNAHSKGHEAAKALWLKYHKGDGVVQ